MRGIDMDGTCSAPDVVGLCMLGQVNRRDVPLSVERAMLHDSFESLHVARASICDVCLTCKILSILKNICSFEEKK